jgi:anti-anti-sigma factor
VATAKDPHDKRVDPSSDGPSAESLEMTILPVAGGTPNELPVGFGNDLLGLVVKQPANGVCVLVVDGELDALTAPLLAARIHEQLAAAPAHLIVDLEAVRFFGSSGLNCLLNARELIQQTPGVQLHIAGVVTRAVARPLEVTGLLERFDSYLTLADALTALAE